MSKINTVDAIQYLENVCYELLHAEERTTTIGSQTFKNQELNDNLQLLVTYMKFIIDKKMEIPQKIDTKLEYWEDE
jgi:hypothetical protein